MWPLGPCRWGHQDYLRLDDFTVECVVCHRTRCELRRAHQAGHYAKEKPVSKLLEYAKALVAAGAGIVLLVYVAWQDKAISLDEANGIWLAVLAALGALGVYATPNKSA